MTIRQFTIIYSALSVFDLGEPSSTVICDKIDISLVIKENRKKASLRRLNAHVRELFSGGAC